MIHNIALWLTKQAVLLNVIPDTDEMKEIYTYSYTLAMETVISWASILILSIILKVFLPTLFFIMLFIPLRIFAGGYHASSYHRCYLLSVLTYLSFCLISSSAVNLVNKTMLAICIIVFCGVIVLLSPASVAEKSINIDEFSKCKTISRILVILDSILLLVALDSFARVYCWFGAFALGQQAVLLVAGRVQKLLAARDIQSGNDLSKDVRHKNELYDSSV